MLLAMTHGVCASIVRLSSALGNNCCVTKLGCLSVHHEKHTVVTGHTGDDSKRNKKRSLEWDDNGHTKISGQDRFASGMITGKRKVAGRTGFRMPLPGRRVYVKNPTAARMRNKRGSIRRVPEKNRSRICPISPYRASHEPGDM